MKRIGWYIKRLRWRLSDWLAPMPSVRFVVDEADRHEDGAWIFIRNGSASIVYRAATLDMQTTIEPRLRRYGAAEAGYRPSTRTGQFSGTIVQ